MIDLKSIWAKQKPNQDFIVIKTRIDFIEQFNCYAATNHITGNHLYIMEFEKNIEMPSFKNFNFKGVRIEVFDLKKNKELNIYLLDSELKEIFSLFIENILEEISLAITQNEAIKISSIVIEKWRRLFDKITTSGLSLEQQKGLLGELLFFNTLLDKCFDPERLLRSWTGPDFDDKDFTFGSNCFEIKFTTSKLPRIKISNERQLDSTNLYNLYLYQYCAETLQENGDSLNTLVDIIRKKLVENNTALKFFNERIEQVGYYDLDREYYNQLYGITEFHFYRIEDDFPKLTIVNLPIGIYNTSYNIERAAIEGFKSNFDKVISTI